MTSKAYQIAYGGAVAVLGLVAAKLLIHGLEVRNALAQSRTYEPVIGLITLAIAILVANVFVKLTPWSIGTAIGVGCVWLTLTVVTELDRVAALNASLFDRANAFDEGIAATVLVCIAAAGLMVTRTCLPSASSVRRSSQTVWGDVAWMSMARAEKLFPETGEIVVGEAYRVDQDSVGKRAFDPKKTTSWGRGGKAKLLGFDLSFDSTHMMFFAGSGGFKTTSTVVPTALRYSGSMVVLDPAIEVGPTVIGSRLQRGRTVVAMDPTADCVAGFNVFETLLTSSKLDEDCASLARLFVAETKGGGSGSSEYFTSQSTNMLAGLLYLVATDLDYEPDQRTLRTVRSLIAQPTKDVVAMLKNKVAAPQQADFVRESLGQFVGMAEQTFSGVLSSVAKDTAWLSMPIMQRW